MSAPIFRKNEMKSQILLIVSLLESNILRAMIKSENDIKAKSKTK